MEAAAFDAEHGGRAGLSNVGNTCYINASVQCLAACMPLAALLVGVPSLPRPQMPPRGASPSAIAPLLASLLSKLWGGKYRLLVPTDLVREIKRLNPAWLGPTQQDAQELVRFLLDAMHDELLDTKNAFALPIGAPPAAPRAQGVPSRISEIFMGQLESNVTCDACGHSSSSTDTFLDLSVEIPSVQQRRDLRAPRKAESSAHKLLTGVVKGVSLFLGGDWVEETVYDMYDTVTLMDCISAFCATENMTAENQYHCDRCKTRTNAKKRIRIKKLPEVLIVTVKRFRYSVTSMTKIGKHVTFPLADLDMSNFLSADALKSVSSKEDRKYDLTGVVNHIGSISYGHYIAYTRNMISGSWRECDDSAVRVVEANQVADTQAYMLFYRRRSSQIQGRRDLIQRHFQSANELQSFVYLARSWVVSLLSVTDCGPIHHDVYLCSHGAVPPTVASKVDRLFCKVPLALYRDLEKRFGGGPVIFNVAPCVACLTAIRQRQARQRVERAILEDTRTDFEGTDEEYQDLGLCLVVMDWYQKWELFCTSEDIHSPPPPLDNTPLLDENGALRHTLREGFEFAVLTKRSFARVHAIYSGGPEVTLTIRELNALHEEQTGSAV
eukprot:m.919899 g.919899  ORF g.919899 m.919899 type:complete len:610 (+) comp60413_c0_seq1:137-1966(+)